MYYTITCYWKTQLTKLRLLKSSSLFTVNIDNIKKKAAQDVSLTYVCELCQRKENNQIEVKFFQLPLVIKDVLGPLHKVQESLTFQELWIKYGNKAQTARKNDEAQKRDLSISDVVESVWKPAYKEWSRLVADVKDGTLTLASVDKFFECYKQQKEDLMQEVIRIFNLGESQTPSNTSELKATAEKRVSQIQQYQELHQYASAAATIWEFKEAMEFSGDFSVIEDLRNQVGIVIITFSLLSLVKCKLQCTLLK